MRPARPIAVLMALAACIVFAGCGGDKEGAPIPKATATALNAELDGVQRRLDEGSAGACRDILGGPRDPNKARAQELIDAMPDDVDSDVRSALQDSFDNLWDLVDQECDDRAQQEKQDKPEVTTPETTPETTPTETTPTETTPTETTPTETTPTSPQDEILPNDGDGNSGGGVPGTGNGNGGGVGAGGGE